MAENKSQKFHNLGIYRVLGNITSLLPYWYECHK